MIKINQLAGMNIHYLFYSLKEFSLINRKLVFLLLNFGEVLRIFS